MSAALVGLRVIEWSGGVAGAYCGKMLAELGADVVKLEAPAGDPLRARGPFPHDRPEPDHSGLFHALNVNKRGITLDPTIADGTALFRRLLADADILIEDQSPGDLARIGLDAAARAPLNPRLIVTSITPFGQTGPHASFQATDLVVFQMSGIGYVTPDGIADPGNEPPLRVGAEQVELIAAITAATATMEALFARRQDGIGRHVDVSAQEALGVFGALNVSNFSHSGQVPSRLRAARRPGGAVVVLPCRNGHICLVTLEERQWEGWLDLMGRPDWSDNPLFADRFTRARYWDALEPLVTEWTRQHDKEEIVRLAQERRVPALPVNTIEDVARSPQLQDRGFLRPLPGDGMAGLQVPAAPYRFSVTPAASARPAPARGQDNAAIFGDVLGVSAAEMVRLRRLAVI